MPLRKLERALPAGAAARRWRVLAALIGLFIAGYLAYAVLYWGRHTEPTALVVPGIFFFGACFVWLACSAALHTALELQRVPVLERESLTDPLTGLYNRRYLERRLEEEFARARRHALPLALLVIDIDHFKRINDAHGHPAGDRVLAELARVILETVRAGDVAARYGGEEFVVIASGTPAAMAGALAERLRRGIETHEFRVPGRDGAALALAVTASLGVATLAPGVGDARSLLAEADRALYRAKAEGRNRVAAA